MFKDLVTERLILKNISYEDADFMYKEFTTEEVNRYLYDAEPASSVEEVKGWIDDYTADEPRNQHRWILVLKENGEKIGTCGFHCWNSSKGSVEVGYDLLPEYWREGYMSEALNEILRFAKDEMKVKQVYAHIFDGNVASEKTALKCGFINTNQTYFEEFRGDKYLHFIYLNQLS